MKKKFVTPLGVIPYFEATEKSLKIAKTKRQILIELLEASLGECEKNKIDLEEINYFVFQKEYKSPNLEKYIFIYDLD